MERLRDRGVEIRILNKNMGYYYGLGESDLLTSEDVKEKKVKRKKIVTEHIENTNLLAFELSNLIETVIRRRERKGYKFISMSTVTLDKFNAKTKKRVIDYIIPTNEIIYENEKINYTLLVFRRSKKQ